MQFGLTKYEIYSRNFDRDYLIIPRKVMDRIYGRPFQLIFAGDHLIIDLDGKIFHDWFVASTHGFAEKRLPILGKYWRDEDETQISSYDRFYAPFWMDWLQTSIEIEWSSKSRIHLESIYRKAMPGIEAKIVVANEMMEIWGRRRFDDFEKWTNKLERGKCKHDGLHELTIITRIMMRLAYEDRLNFNSILHEVDLLPHNEILIAYLASNLFFPEKSQYDGYHHKIQSQNKYYQIFPLLENSSAHYLYFLETVFQQTRWQLEE